MMIVKFKKNIKAIYGKEKVENYDLEVIYFE